MVNLVLYNFENQTARKKKMRKISIRTKAMTQDNDITEIRILWESEQQPVK